MLDQQQRATIQTEVNDKAASPGSSSSQHKLFNTLGIVVFLLGTGAAGFVYWNGTHRASPSNGQGTSAAEGGWQDGTLSPQDSKRSSRDIELYSGKVGMLAVRLRDWAEQPDSLAIIIATVSALVALACFLVADL